MTELAPDPYGAPDHRSVADPRRRPAPVVLVVEDDPDIRLLVRFALESGGFAVEAVGTGEAALERLGRADAMVLDLGLPGMDGFDVLEVLGGGGPPVVVVSAHADRFSRERALSGGARAFVAKPFTTDELLDALTRAGLPPPA